ncbi:hypothetical protein F7725_023627 [Dissostichus mawsoni]|uniref:Solute carrier family 22 member 7 n=1 Tax=Dissostichus mawsoni TaxID=36200 RepID=A0A7J5XX23_DISMA|nr:hypothetical protein F7725_023627 [Dissostichus mawsoni]
MKFENILEEIDGFGPFQIVIIVLLCAPRIVLPCHYLLNNFIAALPPHRCDISPLDDGVLFRNLTQQQRLTVSLPLGEDGGFRSCEMFSEPQFQLLVNGSKHFEATTVPCQSGWVYDNSTFTSTLATEWDLVCDRKSLTQTTSSIFFFGVMIGSIAFGFLSDRYGRRNTLLASYIMAAVFGFSSAFANSYVVFAVLRFFTGFGLTESAWIPESARWLLAHGKVEKAKFYLDKCARFNKRGDLSSKINLETLSSIENEGNKDKNYTYLDLIKTPKMRKLTLLTGIVWYGVASTYYGISLNISGLGLNIYLTHFIYAAIEVPAKLMVYCCLNIVGRRKYLWHLRIVVAILGKGLSEAAFTTVFLYTTELYPTVVRQNGLGYTSFMSRLGVSLAPLILMLEDVWTPLPQIIICSVASVCGLIVLPCHYLLNNFIAALPPHHCDISPLDDGGLFRNLTQQQRLTVSLPLGEDGGFRSCEMFSEPQFQLLVNGSKHFEAKTVPCQSGWVYDNSTFTSTLATEWDLVCDRKSLTQTTSSIFFFGAMIGSIAFGFFSDR